MPSCPIIEDFDVVKDVGTCRVAREPGFLRDPLFLQAREEGFYHGIIVAIPTAAHASLELMVPAEPDPCIAAELGTLVRVDDDRDPWPSPPMRAQ